MNIDFGIELCSLFPLALLRQIYLHLDNNKEFNGNLHEFCVMFKATVVIYYRNEFYFC